LTQQASYAQISTPMAIVNYSNQMQ